MYRIKNQETVLGGVCLGLAENLKTDVSMVRVVFVILFFTPFPIAIAYFILWAVLPKQYYQLADSEGINENNINLKSITNMSNQSKNGNMVGGLILILLGAIFSFKTFFDINLFSYLKNMWPLILIGLGVWIIVKEKDDNGGGDVNSNATGTGY
jgi:phage shock protein PspC (stress-responsive transcriptional regulator)